jgi:hypothetical protein
MVHWHPYQSLLMTSSLAQFITTPKFLAMGDWVEGFYPTDNDIQPLASAPPQPSQRPSLPTAVEERGGIYFTMSERAIEQEYRQQQQQKRSSSAQS